MIKTNFNISQNKYYTLHEHNRNENKLIHKNNYCENVNFTSHNTNQSQKVKNNTKKFLPYAMTGLFTIFGINSCEDNSDRISDSQNINNTHIEYCNVKPETKASLDSTIYKIKSTLRPDNDFLKDVDINITNYYKDMNDNHSFKKFLKEQFDTKEDKGVSFYSDKKLKRIIIIQEGAHDNATDKAFNEAMGLGYTSMPTLKHSLVHEIGHQFDEYFGHDHNATFAKKWDNIMAMKEKDEKQNPYWYENTPQEDTIETEYKYNSGLSDKTDFKIALLKDIENIKQIRKTNPKHLACNIEYYTQDINLDKPVTIQDIEEADYARAEVYANLFAYAMGENDGDKTDFVNNFKNCYKIVTRDIAKYLDTAR